MLSGALQISKNITCLQTVVLKDAESYYKRKISNDLRTEFGRRTIKDCFW